MANVEYKPFQQASIDTICRHLEKNDRALCADEAGLGKTFIARGVIEKSAKRKIESIGINAYKSALHGWWEAFCNQEKITKSAGGGKLAKANAVRNFVREITQKEDWEKDKDKWKDSLKECGVYECIEAISDTERLSEVLCAVAKLYTYKQDTTYSRNSDNADEKIVTPLIEPLKYAIPRAYRVLYVCCNLAIADQNVKKLVPIRQCCNVSSKDKPDRLSVLYHYLDKYPTPYIEIFPITATISKVNTPGNENEKIILMGDPKAEIPTDERQKAENRSIEGLDPDLIIFDEFQNFSDMIHLIDMDDCFFDKYLQSLDDASNLESGRMFANADVADDADDEAKRAEDVDRSNENRVEALIRCRRICTHFAGKKMLFLSATPFHKVELEKKNINQLDMKALLDFLKKGSYEKYKKALDSGNSDEIERILYMECGIFRNERIRLMRKNNVAYHIIECSGEGLLERAIDNGNSSGTRAVGIVNTTPDFEDVNVVYKSTYLTGRMSGEGLYTPLDKKHSRYEKLKDIVYSPAGKFVMNTQSNIEEDIEADIEEIRQLLWIPPIDSKESLGGVFEKYRKYSKSIVFSSLLVTPFSVCKRLNAEIGNNSFELDENEKSTVKLWLLENAFGRFEKKGTIADLFIKYLMKNGGSIFENENDKVGAIVEYCKAGALPDVISEYVDLGFSGKDLMDVFSDEYSTYAYAMNKEDLDKCTEGISIRKSFNSPFYPFVLMTTSIGSEGLDFHLYCNRLIHYTLPTGVTQLEQKNGRIDRKNSLAQRRWWSCYSDRNIPAESMEKLNRDSGGMIPDWDAGEGNLHYFFMCIKYTSEKEKIEELLKEKAAYRNAIGTDMTLGDKEINLCPYSREHIVRENM